jgi:alkaline phosphatase
VEGSGRIAGLVALGCLVLLGARPAGAQPRNVILVIGDGMGAGHVEAARLYKGAPLAWEAAPHRAEMITSSATTLRSGAPTDSAAAATAMSTGRKVTNLVISVAFPGDQRELETLVEFFHARDRSAGLVTTSYLTDATPAGMAAHALFRFELADIAGDYLEQTRPEVLLGGGGNELDPLAAAAAGYTVVSERAGMVALGADPVGPVAGLFGEGAEGMPFEWDYAQGSDSGYDALPFLREMTAAALDWLDADPDGFFLLVEQEGTDRAGHMEGSDVSRIGRDVFAALELEAAVEAILSWLSGREDTLVIVTADHETGGLEVEDQGPGELPLASWSTSDHTNARVPVYAFGPRAELVSDVLDNTQIRAIAAPEPAGSEAAAAALVALLCRSWHRRRRPGGAGRGPARRNLQRGGATPSDA